MKDFTKYRASILVVLNNWLELGAAERARSTQYMNSLKNRGFTGTIRTREDINLREIINRDR